MQLSSHFYRKYLEELLWLDVINYNPDPLDDFRTPVKACKAILLYLLFMRGFNINLY